MSDEWLKLGIACVLSGATLAGLFMVLQYLRESLINASREAAIRHDLESALDTTRRRIDVLSDSVMLQTEKLTQLNNRRQ